MTLTLWLLWSKLMESLVASFTMEETANNWKGDQYGGKKGSSTDHVLVGLWNKVLTGLDNNSKAVVVSAIDFSKSFSRCSFQEILKSYQKLGLSNWGIQMHAAFLTNRRMRVKVGNVLSNEQEVTGGAVQGRLDLSQIVIITSTTPGTRLLLHACPVIFYLLSLPYNFLEFVIMIFL